MALSYSNLVGNSPASTALSNKTNPQPLTPLVGSLAPKPFLPSDNSNISSDGTALFSNSNPTSAFNLHQGLLPTLTAQGGTHTTTDASGNTISTKINPAVTGNNASTGSLSASTPSTSYTSQGAGNTVVNQTTGETAAQAQGGNYAPAVPATGPQTTPSGATVDPSTGALISAPSTAQPSNNTYNAATAGLVNIGQNGSSGYNTAVNNLAQFNSNLAKTYGNIESSPIPLVFQQGKEQVIAKQAAGQEAALQGAVNQEQTQQSQQIGALQGAGNLSTATVQTPYGTPVYSFANGSNLNGGTTNSALNTAVNSAVQLVQNGANPNDPNVQALLSPFGIAGTQAFTNAQQQLSGGTYNPTASSAISTQNASQGQQYQGQATALGTTLQQLTGVTAPIVSLLNGAGLNQEQNPFYNQSINTYSAQLQNPAAVASLKAGMAEIKNYVGSILGTGGDLTPTDISNLTSSFDPGNFTASQLQLFLSNLNNYGQIRLQGFQSTAANSYGGNSSNPTASLANVESQMQGSSPATPTANATIPPNNTPTAVTTSNPVAQALLGGLMSAPGAILNMIKGITSSIF